MGAKLPPVTLGRLVLRGAEPDLAAARGRLLDALDRAPWPHGESDEVVILRSVQVRGEAWRLADQTARVVAEQARDAVDGWSAQADAAVAIRFASTADMRACLLRDLLRGQTARRWFWQRQRELLGQPLARALAGVMCEQALDLPELLGRLQARSHPGADWSALWHSLDDAASRQTLAHIATATGWQVASMSGHSQVATSIVLASALVDAAEQVGRTLAIPAGGLITSGPARLLALYLLWRHQPALLARTASAAAALTQVAHLLAPRPDEFATSSTPERTAGDAIASLRRSPSETAGEITPTNQGERQGERVRTVDDESPIAQQEIAQVVADDNQTGQPANEASLAESLVGRRRPFDRSNKSDPIAPTHAVDGQGAASPRATNAGASGTKDDIGEPHKGGIRLARQGSDAEDAYGSGDINIVTRCGGLFYLLNFLNLRSVQTLLNAAQPSATSPLSGAISANGWCWLARLGQVLDLPLDPPLQRFLAGQAGLGTIQALATLPPLPDEARLIAIGLASYGDELWRADNLSLPARLLATRSHVDVHFRAGDVSLELRRSGLDVNPGWLPWLGRVVTFHYGSGREPGGQRP